MQDSGRIAARQAGPDRAMPVQPEADSRQGSPGVRRRPAWFWPIVLTGLAAHLAAAVYSVGYYHRDEYWQTVEFAACLLDPNTCGDLPWEYHERMRPWLQPLLYAGLTRLSELAGVTSRVSSYFGLRLVSGLVGFASSLVLCALAARWLDDRRLTRWAFVLIQGAWFMPFLHVRTSSENLGSCLLIFALGALELRTGPRGPSPGPLRLAAVGILMGLAFEARYQIGLCIAGLVLWMSLVERWKPGRILTCIGACLLVVAAGTLLDSWLYGQWVVAPYHYARLNLVEGRAARYGSGPWWLYLAWAPQMLPPLSAFILLFSVASFVLRRRHVTTWCLVPFVGVHMLIGRKAMRLLLPIAPLLLVSTLLGLQALMERSPKLREWLARHWTARVLLVVSLAVDAVALVHTTTSPARHEWGFYAAMSRALAERPLPLWSSEGDPYGSSDGKLGNHFLRPASLIRIQDPGAPDGVPRRGEPVYWFTMRAPESLPDDVRRRCELVFDPVTPRVELLVRYRIIGDPPRWQLRRCAP